MLLEQSQGLTKCIDYTQNGNVGTEVDHSRRIETSKQFPSTDVLIKTQHDLVFFV